MEWTKVKSEPIRRSQRLKFGETTITISEAEHAKNGRWQHVVISLGEFSDKPIKSCMATWPREALAQLRRQLDAFEESLNDPA
jgi:hypothetical protein